MPTLLSLLQSRREHFSRENPYLNPISHFSGQNSIFFIKIPYWKWEMIFEQCETSILIYHILFPVTHIPLNHSIVPNLLVSHTKNLNILVILYYRFLLIFFANRSIKHHSKIYPLIYDFLPWREKQEVRNEAWELGSWKWDIVNEK